jgi:mannosyl-3-phosphoglycerate phosphatase
MKLIISDLDGTLLHPQTYSFDPAEPALARIRKERIPLILCTSKTRAEVEYWRGRLDNDEPFIVENGGALFIPRNYFPFRIKTATQRDGYDVLEFGADYKKVTAALRESSAETGCEILGFHQMSVAEISVRTLLPVRQAEMAKRRDYDEPFEILGTGTHNLLRAIEARGYRWTRGDRLYHVSGKHDKALAVRCLIALYRKALGPVTTIGIGDGYNDVEFLSSVDAPRIIQSRNAMGLKVSVPAATVTTAPGPHGWNEAVLEAVAGAPGTVFPEAPSSLSGIPRRAFA